MGKLQYEITGKHDIDSKWMKNVRENNPSVKIDVRVLFDGWTIQDFTNLLIDHSEQTQLAKTIADFCRKQKFDGIVLEVWSQIGGSVRNDVLIDLIEVVSQRLKNNELELILVLPPSGERLTITPDEFRTLSKFVTAFSLMTYDYSSPQRPGPNSPVNWVENSVEHLVPDTHDPNRAKILLGLNFYGNDYTISGGGPIVGHEFINLLKAYKGKLKLDEESKENFFEVR